MAKGNGLTLPQRLVAVELRQRISVIIHTRTPVSFKLKFSLLAQERVPMNHLLLESIVQAMLHVFQR